MTSDLVLNNRLSILVDFLSENPRYRPSRVGRGSTFGSHNYQDDLKRKFLKGREVLAIAPPTTIPDPLVSLVLEVHFEVSHSQLERVRREHSLSMAAENAVGGLLERYIAEVVETRGWVWCSGDTAKSIDFIRRSGRDWKKLQVKNRDNSENSSSAAIRDGTDIEKWYRTKSRSGETRWEDFPEVGLSEEKFQNFCRRYLGGRR
jgi:hypothetical protein